MRRGPGARLGRWGRGAALGGAMVLWVLWVVVFLAGVGIRAEPWGRLGLLGPWFRAEQRSRVWGVVGRGVCDVEGCGVERGVRRAVGKGGLLFFC